MEWVNLHTSTLDSPELVGAEPVCRATWLFLLRYCCGQENGGVIANCNEWPDRKWQQLVRVTAAEVAIECELWRWEGNDLHVTHYPLRKESEVRERREAGRIGGAAKTQAKTQASRDNGTLGGRPETQAEPKQNPSNNPTEGKGREGNGMEGGARGVPQSLDTPAFRLAWERWLTYWGATFANGRAMPEQTAYSQLLKIRPLGPHKAIEAIDNSIHRGLREPAEPFAGSRVEQPRPETRVQQISAA